MFPVLFGFTALAAGSAAPITPGLSLARPGAAAGAGAGLPASWLGFALVLPPWPAPRTVLWLRPEAFLLLVRRRTRALLLAIFLSSIRSCRRLPQELVFRVLFFRRYGGLMPGRAAALAVNAGVFSFAHLMYWNWPALVLTLVFAWAYERQGNFPAAVLLHALAGWILFTLGLGVFFYAGFVERPF
jgi:hypothetical protein